MFGLIKKNIYGIVHASNHTKCVSLSNQTCMTLPTVINLHLNEYSQDFHYYSFVVKLDRFVGSCNTLNDLSNKVCISNKAEDLKVSMFYMIKGINKSKIKHISCKYKGKFDGKKYNSDQWWNNEKCRCECKKYHVCEKDYIWNPSACSCENRKYLASIMDNSAITCGEIIESYDEEINFNEKKATCKTKNFYILLALLSIAIALLIAVSIYYYLIKYRAKQKHLLPFHDTNNELREVLY